MTVLPVSPVATSRKTSLFHCSHKGAEHECIIRSFFETCRLRDVSPVAWFKAFFEAVLQGRNDYPDLLPGVRNCSADTLSQSPFRKVRG